MRTNVSPAISLTLLIPALVTLLAGPAHAQAPAGCDITITCDDELPHLKPWATDAKKLMEEWHQRLTNLLPSEGFEPAREISLVIRKTDEGVAGTANDTITVSSHWIEKHPEDIGLIVHELCHVIQDYPPRSPFWVTEGIADYIRWAVYEGKPLEWFPRTADDKGYRQGYRVAGGFLLWLETGQAPGIVNRLNRAMRAGEFSTGIFEEATGKPLDELWTEYASAE